MTEEELAHYEILAAKAKKSIDLQEYHKAEWFLLVSVENAPALIAALREAWQERDELFEMNRIYISEMNHIYKVNNPKGYASANRERERAEKAEAERDTALADLALSRFQNGQMQKALVDVCAERDAAIARARAPGHTDLMVSPESIDAFLEANPLTSAEAERDALLAQVATLREALEWYADQFCEHGAHYEGCGKLNTDDCAGCKARAAIRARETGKG